MVFASNPELYGEIFETSSEEDEIDWIIPSSEEEINEIMKMIEADLADSESS